MKSKSFDKAIIFYEEALDTTKSISDNDGRTVKTLSGMLKAYEEKGDKAMANQMRKRLKNIKRAQIKALDK